MTEHQLDLSDGFTIRNEKMFFFFLEKEEKEKDDARIEDDGEPRDWEREKERKREFSQSLEDGCSRASKQAYVWTLRLHAYTPREDGSGSGVSIPGARWLLVRLLREVPCRALAVFSSLT